jgi:hypothetical protein
MAGHMIGDEPHLILLPGNPQTFECSECAQLFMPGPAHTRNRIADDFLDHMRERHTDYEPPFAVKIELARVK